MVRNVYVAAGQEATWRAAESLAEEHELSMSNLVMRGLRLVVANPHVLPRPTTTELRVVEVRVDE